MPPATPADHTRPVRFHDRLLVEAVRSLERDGATLFDDAKAEEAGRSAGGELEHRLVRRAEALPVAGELRAALSHVSTVVGWTIALGGLIAFIFGAGALRAALALQPPVVNFYWVFSAALGVQTLALVLWISVMLFIVARRGTGAPGAVISLGNLVLAAARWLSSRSGGGSEAHRAAVEAKGRIQSGRLGRWAFSAITHGLWLSFNIGALLMLFVLLATRQYTFVWETTILSEREYVRLTQAISHLPKAAGFPVPDEKQIAASRWVGDPARLGPMAHEARQAWAGLLVGSIVVYGFGPRLLLLGLSLSARRTWRNAYRIDTAHPAYAILSQRLVPPAQRLQPPLAASRDAPTDQPAPPSRAQPGTGPPAILGLELPLPRSGWPPAAAAQWEDLGLIETRDDRHRTLERLRGGERPRIVVIACDLTSTPDRGMKRFIRDVADFAPTAVVLSGGESLRQRGYGTDGVAGRVKDWREACMLAGLADDRVIELDLDHITAGGLERLALLAGDESQPAHARRIEPAFALIAEETERWLARSASPDAKSQADVHQRIAALYRAETSSWRSLLDAPASLNPAQLTDQFRAGAERTLALLPHRLKASPKWLAAGALSGAMSCIAAAALISPAAIAALPAWSAIGAAIAGVLQWSGAAGNEAADAREAASGVEIGDAVRAAALFALLLELQGRDEATITRLLDRIIGDDDRPLNALNDVRAWLDALRHRLDIALAEGAA
jgi:hypothetical protein